MSRDVDIPGEIVLSSDLAICLRANGVEVWLPREQIAIVHDVEGVVVTMPERLAKAKGIY